MTFSRTRGFVLTLGIGAALLAVPAQSQACAFLDCLFGKWCGSRTTYQPIYAPAPCAPACAPQACNYLPQTSYRTAYRQVPVTACQVTTRRSFWTGVPVTSYRPVTTWVSQPVMVPYTTYRAVYSNPCCPTVGCNPCGTAGCGIGTSYAAPVSGCSSCAIGTTSTPQVPYSGSLETQPKTFQQPQNPPAKRLDPIPNPNTSSAPGLKLIDPDNRTTMQPVRQAARLHLVSSPVKPAAAELPVGVWRASSD